MLQQSDGMILSAAPAALPPRPQTESETDNKDKLSDRSRERGVRVALVFVKLQNTIVVLTP